MKHTSLNLRYNFIYYLIGILLFILTGCGSSASTKFLSLDTNHTKTENKKHQEKLVIYGRINPELKVTLESDFKATDAQNGCLVNNGGWNFFITVPIEDHSYGKNTYRLSVPIKWENSLGSNRCAYELHSASLHVEYPDNMSSISTTDIILGQNNDDDFRINGQTYGDTNRNYKVRYLKGLSLLYCTTEEKKVSNNFICVSDLNISAIAKEDLLPPKLDYHVNIFIQNH